MANYCNYLIRAKGSKKAALMAFASTPKSGDFDYIVKEYGTDDEYVVWYQGECKWSLDAYSAERNGLKINIESYDEAFLRSGECTEFWDLTMRQRSEVLQLDLFAHSWANVSSLGSHNRWKNGQEIPGCSIDFEELKKAENIKVNDGCSRFDDIFEDDYDWKNDYPEIISIEGTAYAGRIERIEHIKEGDLLRLKADYDCPYYSPVGIEVFNSSGGSLGYLVSYGNLSLDEIASHIHELKAKVASVTPLSKRRKNARYALMDVELYCADEEDAEVACYTDDRVETYHDRAEEERERKAEEKRKAEDEAKAKREEELRKYNEACKKWERECEDIKAMRAIFVDDLDHQTAKEKAIIEKNAMQKRDEAVARANAVLKEQTERKTLAESTLATLGMFQFGEKKAQKAIIAESTKLLEEAQAAIDTAEKTYLMEMKEADRNAEAKRSAIRKEAVSAYPLPEKPKKFR